MAEIGIILLLFEVGLETDVGRLMKSGIKSIIVALSGFILPMVFGFVLAYSVFELPLLVSLFIGGTLTATSIGITVRVLADLGAHQKYEGRIVLGAAVLDDVMGVVLLAVLYEFSQDGGIKWANAGKVLLFIAVFFALAPLAAKLMSNVIKHFGKTTEMPGLIPTTIVALVLFFAWVAHSIGSPELLGGFAAGLALSRRFFLPFGVALHEDVTFAEKVEKEMKPIIHLFTPIFFVVVGLSLNLKAIDWSSPFIWLFSLSILAVAFISKLVGPMFLKESWPSRLVMGTSMVPRGEVGLIFAELGLESGILSNQIYASIVIVVAFSTLVPPFILKALYRRHSDVLLTAQ
jgi:Kef-type K+ transport system membrane component KefB